MKIETILKAVGGELLTPLKLGKKKMNQVKIDSRYLEKNDVFIAIHGKTMDGHKFIQSALQKEVAAIIVEKEIELTQTKIPIIKVNSTAQSLLDLASYVRAEHQVSVVAVTGSVGKTTTKELIAGMLETKYQVLKSQGSYNNHIGMPLTLLQLQSNHEIVVLELGMNHEGEIHRLSKVCKPDVAVLTNIGSSHIGHLKSKKNIYKAKLEILDGMEKGTIVVNHDDGYLRKLKKSKKGSIHSIQKQATKNFSIKNPQTTLEFLTFTIVHQKLEYDVTFPVPGLHLLSNIALAIETALLYQVEMKEIVYFLEHYQGMDKRMKIWKLKEKNILIDDCYNASFESVRGVLELIEQEEKFKIIILGDILELGEESIRIHKKIIRKLKQVPGCLVLLVGESFEEVKDCYLHFKTNEAMIHYLEEVTVRDQIILMKGSRGMKLEEVRDYLLDRLKQEK